MEVGSIMAISLENTSHPHNCASTIMPHIIQCFGAYDITKLCKIHLLWDDLDRLEAAYNLNSKNWHKSSVGNL